MSFLKIVFKGSTLLLSFSNIALFPVQIKIKAIKMDTFYNNNNNNNNNNKKEYHKNMTKFYWHITLFTHGHLQ